MSIRALLGGGTKCRTIDVCDIFGDGSGKALYRLDGNANDESGNYHGTETAITYGGGVYERGAIATSGKIDCGSGSKILIPSSSSFTISVWIKRVDGIRTHLATRMNTSSLYGDGIYWESDNKIWINFATGSASQVYTSSTSTHLANGNYRHVCYSVDRTSQTFKVYLDNVEIAMGALTVPASSYDNNLNTLLFSNHSALSSGTLDQVRFFNRALTATEVATLYNECAPTSTVDNINPFEDGSLKALYQFNGDATDKTGVYNGTATNVTYGTGKFGQCAVSNGSSSKITVDPVYTTDISFSIWAYVTTLGVSQMFFGESDTIGQSASVRVGLGLTAGNNFLVSLGNGTLGLNNSTIASGLVVNTWNHFVLSIKGTSVTLYKNGNIMGNLTSTTTIGSHVAGNFSFMNYGNYLNGTFNLRGSIDQLRIFNKALTPMEVASLYNETTPLEEPMHSLVDPFKDGSGKALYRLDGNALDESGNYNGTATNVTYGAGRFGRAGVFNGTTSNVVTSSMPNVGNDYSISVWIKTNQLSPNPFSAITNGSSSTNPYSYTIYQNPNGVIVFQDSHTSATSLNTASNAIASTTEWYHIVATKVGTARKLYINGTLSVSDNLGTATVAQPTSLMIGKYYGQNIAPYTFNGSIDQVRIFNRALTQAEVTALYQEI